VYDQNTRDKVLSASSDVKIAAVNPVIEKRKFEKTVPDTTIRLPTRRVFTEDQPLDSDEEIKSKIIKIDRIAEVKASKPPRNAVFTRLSDKPDEIKEKPDVSSVVIASTSYKSVFNRLGDKQKSDDKVKTPIVSLKNGPIKEQKVLLVQRVPAKAVMEERVTKKLSSIRDKSVTFSSEDEILEIKRYNFLKFSALMLFNWLKF
jgi:hypothetical protein